MSKAKKVPFKVNKIWFGQTDWHQCDPAVAWEDLEFKFGVKEMDKIISFLRAGMTVTTDFAHFQMAEDEQVEKLEI